MLVCNQLSVEEELVYSMLAVKIHGKFMRSWTQANRIYFVHTLVFDVFFKKVLGKDIALEQEIVIGFKRIQYFTERARHLLDQFLLFSRQFIEISILRLTRIYFACNTIQTCHEDRRKGEIGIAGWVGCAEFNTFGFGAFGGRDTADRRTIALRVSDINRGFVTGHKASI